MDANSRRFRSDFVEGLSGVVAPKHKFLSRTARFVRSLIREEGFVTSNWKDSLVRIASGIIYPHRSACSCKQSQQPPRRPLTTADICSLSVLPVCQSAHGVQKLVDKLNSGCQSDPSVPAGPSVPGLPFSRSVSEDITLPRCGIRVRESIGRPRLDPA